MLSELFVTFSVDNSLSDDLSNYGVNKNFLNNWLFEDFVNNLLFLDVGLD